LIAFSLDSQENPFLYETNPMKTIVLWAYDYVIVRTNFSN